MKKTNKYVLLSLFLGASVVQGQLILPMPGQKLENSTPKSTKEKAPQKPQKNGYTQPEPLAPKSAPINNQTPTKEKRKVRTTVSKSEIEDSSTTIIPMPTTGEDGRHEQENKLITIPATTANKVQEPLLAVPSSEPKVADEPKQKVEQSAPNSFANKDEEDISAFFENTEFPVPPNKEIATPQGTNVEDLLPPAQTETAVANNGQGGSVNVFPKDTGSAIFMVMKSWQCNDYDGVKLLEQALEVYSKDADDAFSIKGYENYTKDFTISIDEEDITIDELLDLYASKTGNDWGADIANKTIYIYPKGIKTESYVSW